MAKPRPADATPVVVALEAESDELSRVAADAIFSSMPGYSVVPRERVLGSVRTNVARAVETLRSRHAPEERTRAEAAATTLERARQGVPIGDIIRAYRLSLRVIHDRFLTLASEARLDASTVLDCSNLLWEVGDWFTAIAAVEYRHYELDLAVQGTLRRSGMLRDILTGSLPEPELRKATASLGLDWGRQYSVFCISPSALRGRGEYEQGDVVEVAGNLLGLVLPDGADYSDDFPVGIGPERPLGDVLESTGLAIRIGALVSEWEAGAYRLEDVTWRLAAGSEPDVAELLHRKYIDPIVERGAFGEVLLESVRAYLMVDRNYAEAAQNLMIHPNTLRYRLSKFEEIVGCSLMKTRVIVDLAMVLDLPPMRDAQE